MKNFFFTIPGIFKMGFTNQIFSLITAIIVSINENKKIIIVDSFSKDFIDSNLRIKCSELIKLPLLNDYLKKYNITIFVRENLNFKIHNIYELKCDTLIEVTDYFKSKCHEKITFLNDLKNNIIVKYSLNDILFEDIYEPNEEIKYIFDNIIIYNHFGMRDSYNKNLFEDLLINIKYNDIFNDYANNFIKTRINNDYKTQKINVIHLRLETDAIEHWSKLNNMSPDEFLECIENKYIYLIILYIKKNSENIILTHATDNKVIKFMKKNNYNIHFIDKSNFKGREINAVYDLFIGKYCNNIFIENIGSTFSYYLSTILPSTVKRVQLDLNNIREQEVVI